MTNDPRAQSQQREQSDVEWLRDLARGYANAGSIAPELSHLLAIADELERLRALCPSLVDLDANEALTPDSTITVAVGYLHTLLEKDHDGYCNLHGRHLGDECPECPYEAALAASRAENAEQGRRAVEAFDALKPTQIDLARCRAENAALTKLLELAVCPNRHCEGGSIPTADGYGGWEQIQCQWCDERAKALRASQQKG